MKPKVPVMAGHSDQFQTPPQAVDILVPYLKPQWIIWECAWGQGKLANHLIKRGFNVVGDGSDFLTSSPQGDCIVTNPPYSIKDKFIARCYELRMPFALLLPITALEGKFRQSYYSKYGLQLLLPNKRFNFETPSGEGSGSWFATAWFTNGLQLPSQITFVDISGYK